MNVQTLFIHFRGGAVIIHYSLHPPYCKPWLETRLLKLSSSPASSSSSSTFPSSTFYLFLFSGFFPVRFHHHHHHHRPRKASSRLLSRPSFLLWSSTSAAPDYHRFCLLSEARRRFVAKVGRIGAHRVGFHVGTGETGYTGCRMVGLGWSVLRLRLN